MGIYNLITIGVVVLTTIIMVIVFAIRNLINIRNILSIAICMIISIGITCLVPFSVNKIVGHIAVDLFFVVLMVFLAYITLTFLIIIFVASILPESKIENLKNKITGLKENIKKKKELNKIKREEKIKNIQLSKKEANEEKNEPDLTKNNANSQKDDIIIKKDVDTGQNIDKMGIGESFLYDSSLHEIESESVVELDVDALVERAFQYKKDGKPLDAIESYMSILTLKPDKELVFMVVLDICVLYKGLGQSDLARLILNSYIQEYGDIMDMSIKRQIEQNLD